MILHTDEEGIVAITVTMTNVLARMTDSNGMPLGEADMLTLVREFLRSYRQDGDTWDVQLSRWLDVAGPTADDLREYAAYMRAHFGRR